MGRTMDMEGNGKVRLGHTGRALPGWVVEVGRKLTKISIKCLSQPREHGPPSFVRQNAIFFVGKM